MRVYCNLLYFRTPYQKIHFISRVLLKKNENVAPLFDLSREPNTVSFLERTKEELNQD